MNIYVYVNIYIYIYIFMYSRKAIGEVIPDHHDYVFVYVCVALRVCVYIYWKSFCGVIADPRDVDRDYVSKLMFVCMYTCVPNHNT